MGSNFWSRLDKAVNFLFVLGFVLYVIFLVYELVLAGLTDNHAEATYYLVWIIFIYIIKTTNGKK